MSCFDCKHQRIQGTLHEWIECKVECKCKLDDKYHDCYCKCDKWEELVKEYKYEIQ